MKLRIRYGSRRELLDLPDCAAHAQDLQEAVGSLLGLESASFILSLNGSTPLAEDASLTLTELGIVGGDLLHVILQTTPGPASTSSQPANQSRVLDMPVSVPGPSGVANMAGDSSDNRVGIDDKGENNLKSNDKRIRGGGVGNPSTSTSHEDASTIKHIKTSTSKAGCSFTSQGSQSNNEFAATTSSSSQGALTLKPSALLCRDGTSYLLKWTYEQSGVSTLHEAVCIAIHVLMLETGFALFLDKEKMTSEDDDTSSSQQLIGRGWRTRRGAEFHYSHPACPDTSCSVVCTSLGPYVLAHGVTSTNDIHQCQIPATDYVRGNVDLKINGAAEVFHNLSRLSRLIKDQIAYPLLSSMRHELDLPELYGFMALPSEVKIMVLSILPVKSIMAMSSMCRELHSVANDNTFWHHLCLRDFGKIIKSSVTSWKIEYIRMYKELQAMRQQSSRTYVIPDWMEGNFVPTVPPNVNPFGEMGPPGIIGGRNDLYPNVPFMPGGFPHPGHLPGPGMLPRPRYDPFGPLPDMDHHPGRRGPGRHGPGRGRGRDGFPPGYY